MTIQPGKQNLAVYCGATFIKTITWKDENGALVNLTGWKARLHMRESVEAAAPFLTLTTENGGIALGGAAGTISLLASATATGALTVYQGVYDLELIAPDTVTVTRLLEGPRLCQPGGNAMTDTVVTPETVFQSLEIGEEKIAIVKEKSVQVVTVGTQGPSGSAAGYTGSINVQLGSYGGVLNMTVVNGLIMSMGIYGM